MTQNCPRKMAYAPVCVYRRWRENKRYNENALSEIFSTCRKLLIDFSSKHVKSIKALKTLPILRLCMIFVSRENRSGAVDMNRRSPARKAGCRGLGKISPQRSTLWLMTALMYTCDNLRVLEAKRTELLGLFYGCRKLLLDIFLKSDTLIKALKTLTKMTIGLIQPSQNHQSGWPDSNRRLSAWEHWVLPPYLKIHFNQCL